MEPSMKAESGRVLQENEAAEKLKEGVVFVHVRKRKARHALLGAYAFYGADVDN